MSKPLGGKNYGSIAHLPGSRMGPADHHCHEGQSVICTEKVRDKHDRIIVQEKLDGSNVGVAKVNGRIYALTRAGWEAHTSPYAQHHAFAKWIEKAAYRFNDMLEEGERIVGEWLYQAHGTRYILPHEPFVAFDFMRGTERQTHNIVAHRLAEHGFVAPHCIHVGGPLSIDEALAKLGEMGRHGAQDPIEGAVWRVERNELISKSRGDVGGRIWKVDFLAKFVRHDKADGSYLESNTNGPAILNTWPMDEAA